MPFGKPTSRPTSEEAARRLIILKHIVTSALAAPPRDMLASMTRNWDASARQTFEKQAEAFRDKAWQGLREAGLWQHLSPREQEYAQTTLVTMTAGQQIQGSWRMEAAQVIMWALQIIPALPSYDTMADHNLLKEIPSRDVTAFIQSSRLRADEELDHERDTAEFWHWRSRTRELIERGDPFPDDPQMKAAGLRSYDDVVRVSSQSAAQEGMIPPCIAEDFPAKGKAYRELTPDEWSEVRSVTVERHFALNWLCGHAPGNKWDETPTDT